MRSSILALALVLCVGAKAFAGEAPRKTSAEERVYKALKTEIVNLDLKDTTLGELLKVLANLTKENFILDPNLPKGVAETRLSIKIDKGGTVQDALGLGLQLAGLRFAILDGAVYITTEGKLADRVLTARGIAEGLSIENAKQPMSVGDALARSGALDPYQDEFVSAHDFISNYPWRHWEAPRYNPQTGLTDYPGPPVWQESPQVGAPRFRYTAIPFFQKPEYLALEQEKREYIEDRDRQAHDERQANARALAALLQLMKDNPDLKAKDILDKLGK